MWFVIKHGTYTDEELSVHSFTSLDDALSYIRDEETEDMEGAFYYRLWNGTAEEYVA